MLSKQLLDGLGEGVGVVNLFGFGVAGVYLLERAPYSAEVMDTLAVALSVGGDIGAAIAATQWATCNVI